MRVITGRVVSGKIDVPSDLAEGTAVTILAPDTEGYRLSPQDELELSEALAEIRSGNFIDAHDLLAELRGSGA